MKYELINAVHGKVITGRQYDSEQVLDVYLIDANTFLFVDDSRHISGVVESETALTLEKALRVVMTSYDAGNYTSSYPTRTETLKKQALNNLNTTITGDSMKTSTINAVLSSFDKGQGNTIELAQKYTFNGLTLDYLTGTYRLQFQSEEHLKAYFIMLFNKDIKDRSIENLDKLFKHLNSGTYLSLNHTDGSNSTVSVDKYAQFKVLFESLGIIEVKSNGKGSKLTQLICEPTTETVTVLSVNGFSNITPLIDGFQVIGLKVELPKQD